MAYTGIYCTALINFQYKAGAYANTTYTAEAYANIYAAEVEGEIDVETGLSSANYASFTTKQKNLLNSVAAAGMAMRALQADLTGASPGVMQTQLNWLWESWRYGIDLLKRTTK